MTSDRSFGMQGEVLTRFGPPRALAYDVAVQADGRIVVAGSTSGSFLLARYMLDGTLDQTFGGDGRVVTDFGSESEGARSVLILPDGRIVAAGYTLNFRNSLRVALARYLPDGTLDTSFGLDGRVTATCY